MSEPSMQQLKKVKAKQEKDRAAKAVEKAVASNPSVAAVAQAGLTNDKPLWYSPDGTDIHVHLPDGRKAIVGEKPRELPRAFYKAAGVAGCLATTQIKPSDYNIPTTPDNADPEKRTQSIRALILAASTADEEDPKYEGAFTPAGLPNVLWLSKRLNFEVQQSERDSAWNQIKAEIENDDSDESEARDDA